MRPVLGKLLRLGLVVLILAGVLLGVIWALIYNEAGTIRLLPYLPGVRVIEPKGALLGDFQARRIEVDLPRGSRLVLIEPVWKGLRLRWAGHVSWHIALTAMELQARSLDLHWVPDPLARPSLPPRSLDLPLAVSIQRLRLDQARSALWGAEPLRNLDAQIELSTPGGLLAPGQHRVVLHRLAWSGWSASGRGQIGTAGHMPLTLDAQAMQSGALGKGDVQIHLKGPLAKLALAADLTWLETPARSAEAAPAPQTLHVLGELQPFAPWPVSQLAAQARRLNLAALLGSLPETALSGNITVRSEAVPIMDKGADAKKIQPDGQRPPPAPLPADLVGDVDLRNDLPGAWDARRLPLRAAKGRIRLPASASMGAMSHLPPVAQVDLKAWLPSLPGHADGELHVNGHWDERDLAAQSATGATALRLVLKNVEPQALDGRAPPLQLQGGLTLIPKMQNGSAPAGLSAMSWTMLADLQGLHGANFGEAGASPLRVVRQRPVSLSLRGQLASTKVDIQELVLRAEDAVARAQGGWERTAAPASPPDDRAPAWRAKGQVQLDAFDPQVWLPWPARMTGRNRLGGQVDFEVDANGQGQAQLQLAPGELGGVPLQGKAAWQSPAGQNKMSASLDADAAGNLVHAEAELPWAVDAQGQRRWGEAAHWQARLDAAALQALQPLAALVGARTISGQIKGQAEATGLWPALSTRGNLALQGLRWQPVQGNPLDVQTASARWDVQSLTQDAPLTAVVEVGKVRSGKLVADKISLNVDGTARAHQARLGVDALIPGRANEPADPVRLDWTAQGGLLDGAKGWRGRVQELSLRLTRADPAPAQTATRGEGASGSAAPGWTPRTWLQAQPFDLSWLRDDSGLHLDVSPTPMIVMGARLTLQRLIWHWPGESPGELGEVDVAMNLEPLNLPALLSKWQPEEGWGGDLMLVGEVRVRHSARQPWVVDAFVARQSGDLSFSEASIAGDSVQRLGIRSGKVALQARQGVWTLTEQFEGRVLGELTGKQTVQARSPDALPTRDDPLTGELDVQIRNLRPWGVWAPAGWRLSGQLQAQALVSGTLGVPLYRGQVKGQNLSFGHALLGVNLTDGVLAMDLQGDQAHLTGFQAKAGSQGGTLSAKGDALLGEQPQATLSLTADHFALLQRVDRRIVVSGQIQAQLGDPDIKVDGRVRVDEGLIDISRADAPTVGDDVNVINRPGQLPDPASDAATPAAGLSKRKLHAAVDVDLGGKLRLRGRGIDTLLTGALRVTTPNNRPSLTGTIKASDGTYAAYGQKLVIERGAIAFTGPIENPRLDILAMRAQSPTAASSDVKVGVNITGTAQDPRVRLYSDPSMSETDKLSWLILGRAPTGLGGADIGLLQTAAVALLSGEGPSKTDNVMAAIGLDELSVRQTDGTVRDTIVNVGKQLSKYWYLGYERNLTATTGNWQLIYRLAQRFTLRAQTGEDNALDLIWSWRWD